jgi:hypothetical protein
MKKLISLLEDLWVVIAFAEEGIYEPAVIHEPLTQNLNTATVPFL